MAQAAGPSVQGLAWRGGPWRAWGRRRVLCVILRSPRLKVSSVDVQGLLLSLAVSKSCVFSPLSGPHLHAHPCLHIWSLALMSLTAPAALCTQLAWGHLVKGWGTHGSAHGIYPPGSNPFSFWAHRQTTLPSSLVVIGGHGLSSGQCNVAEEVQTMPCPSLTPEKPLWLTLFSAQWPDAKDPGKDVRALPTVGWKGPGSPPMSTVSVWESNLYRLTHQNVGVAEQWWPD